MLAVILFSLNLISSELLLYGLYIASIQHSHLKKEVNCLLLSFTFTLSPPELQLAVSHPLLNMNFADLVQFHTLHSGSARLWFFFFLQQVDCRVLSVCVSTCLHKSYQVKLWNFISSLYKGRTH